MAVCPLAPARTECVTTSVAPRSTCLDAGRSRQQASGASAPGEGAGQVTTVRKAQDAERGRHPGVGHGKAVLGRSGSEGGGQTRATDPGLVRARDFRVGALGEPGGGRRRSRRFPGRGWIAYPQTLEQEAMPLPTGVHADDPAPAAAFLTSEPVDGEHACDQRRLRKPRRTRRRRGARHRDRHVAGDLSGGLWVDIAESPSLIVRAPVPPDDIQK